MGTGLFLLFAVLPIAEIVVLMRVISRIGIWDTLFLLIFSGIFGAYLAHIQGRAALLRIQQCLAETRMPSHEMLDGLLIFLGGVLFIIPGFISDAIGLLFLFPLTRWMVRVWIFHSLQRNMKARPTRSQQTQDRDTKGFHRGKDIRDAEIVE